MHQTKLQNASFGETMHNMATKKLDCQPNATTIPYIFRQLCLLAPRSLSGHFSSQVNHLYLIKSHQEHLNSTENLIGKSEETENIVFSVVLLCLALISKKNSTIKL